MDNKEEIINCPACGKKMTKIKMEEQGVVVDVCLDGCGGIYFDNQEFKKFDEEHEDITPLVNAYLGKSFKFPGNGDGIRYCPVCGYSMVKNYASTKHEIQIDDCYGCGGKFLDYSELTKIRAQYADEQDRINDILKTVYLIVGHDIMAQNLDYEKRITNAGSFSLINKIKKQREKEHRKFNKKEMEILSKLNKELGKN